MTGEGTKPAGRLQGALTVPWNLRRHPSVAPIDRPWESALLEQGIQEFNAGHHWHAHEAWEPLWMALEGDDKLFVQGLIMAAAMLVQYGKGVERGVASHWANVQARLPQHAPEKWGVDVAGLLRQLEPFARDAAEGALQRDVTDVRIVRSS